MEAGKTGRKTILYILALMMVISSFLGGCAGSEADRDASSGKESADEQPVVAIAWSNVQDSYSFTSTVRAVEAAGAVPLVLDMVRSYDLEYDDEGMLKGSKDKHGILKKRAAKLVKCNDWQNSNVEEVMKDIDCVIVPGGWDISPTLYYKEQGWHGIEEDTQYSAERDVSDYLLVSYCLDNDLPVLCICRGMQMLSVVSGADIIQDIGEWIGDKGGRYHDMHRDPEKKDLIPHDTDVLSHDSLLYEITGRDKLTGVPAWHHQAVKSVKGTRLKVTAETMTDGFPIIEGVERIDKDFVIGVQFHPEVAVRKVLDEEENADEFMDYDTALAFFNELIARGQEAAEADERSAA